MSALLTAQQVAQLTGLTVQRVYQLDPELRPQFTKRGEKMVTRHYQRAAVDAYIAGRAGGTTRIGAQARAIAARHLAGVVEETPFFVGVAPEDTEAVRGALRGIVADLGVLE